MDFTNAHENLNKIYSEKSQMVIKRNDFNYYQNRITFYYCHSDQYTDMTRLLIRNADSVVYVPFYFIKKDGHVYLNPYFPEAAYNALKSSLFSKDGYSPNHLFENIRAKLEEDTVNDYKDSTVREFDSNANKSTVPTNPEEYVYFHFLRSSRGIGKTTMKRIYALYDNPLEIIRALRRLNKTLVFTNQFSKRNNLIAVLNNEKHLNL